MKTKIVALVAAGAFIGGAMLVLPHSGAAKPEFAASTKKACGQCHQNPAGGGPLKPYGQAFKANGFRLPKGK